VYVGPYFAPAFFTVVKGLVLAETLETGVGLTVAFRECLFGVIQFIFAGGKFWLAV
jgi:hypothetical protein